MSERMHPQDLRAIVAAITGTDIEASSTWKQDTVKSADLLLAELERTAKPEARSVKTLERSLVEKGAREERERIIGILLTSYPVCDSADATPFRLNEIWLRHALEPKP